MPKLVKHDNVADIEYYIYSASITEDLILSTPTLLHHTEVKDICIAYIILTEDTYHKLVNRNSIGHFNIKFSYLGCKYDFMPASNVKAVPINTGYVLTIDLTNSVKSGYEDGIRVVNNTIDIISRVLDPMCITNMYYAKDYDRFINKDQYSKNTILELKNMETATCGILEYATIDISNASKKGIYLEDENVLLIKLEDLICNTNLTLEDILHEYYTLERKNITILR